MWAPGLVLATSGPFQAVFANVSGAVTVTAVVNATHGSLDVAWTLATADPVFVWQAPSDSSDSSANASSGGGVTSGVRCTWSVPVPLDAEFPAWGSVAPNASFGVPLMALPLGVDVVVSISCVDSLHRNLAGQSNFVRYVVAAPALDAAPLSVTVVAGAGAGGD